MTTNATNSTQYFGFPLFIDADKPSWITDWNGTVEELDNILESYRVQIQANTQGMESFNEQVRVLHNLIDEVNTRIDGDETTLDDALASIESLRDAVVQFESSMKDLLVRTNSIEKQLTEQVYPDLSGIHDSIESLYDVIRTDKNDITSNLYLGIVPKFNPSAKYYVGDYVYKREVIETLNDEPVVYKNFIYQCTQTYTSGSSFEECFTQASINTDGSPAGLHNPYISAIRQYPHLVAMALIPAYDGTYLYNNKDVVRIERTETISGSEYVTGYDFYRCTRDLTNNDIMVNRIYPPNDTTGLWIHIDNADSGFSGMLDSIIRKLKNKVNTSDFTSLSTTVGVQGNQIEELFGNYHDVESELSNKADSSDLSALSSEFTTFKNDTEDDIRKLTNYTQPNRGYQIDHDQLHLTQFNHPDNMTYSKTLTYSGNRKSVIVGVWLEMAGSGVNATQMSPYSYEIIRENLLVQVEVKDSDNNNKVGSVKERPLMLNNVSYVDDTNVSRFTYYTEFELSIMPEKLSSTNYVDIDVTVFQPTVTTYLYNGNSSNVVTLQRANCLVDVVTYA